MHGLALAVAFAFALAFALALTFVVVMLATMGWVGARLAASCAVWLALLSCHCRWFVFFVWFGFCVRLQLFPSSVGKGQENYSPQKEQDT